MFKKNLTSKKIIKKAEQLFDYLKLLKSFTKEKYPLLENEDFNNQQILLLKIDELINILKISTQKYISNEINIYEFNQELNSIISLYNDLRVKNPILNAIIYGYLTPTLAAGIGTPVADSYTLGYLTNKLKNPDEEI